MALARVLLLCIAMSMPGGPVLAVDLAGSVERLQGTAVATSLTGFSRPLQPGSTILVGDRVATGADSRLRLRMSDGAVLTLGNTSILTIETYDEDETAGNAVLDIAQGVFLAASGAIARLGTDRATVRTPVAVLGVRGTEIWGNVLPDRLALTILSGAGVIVTTPQGSIELTTPESGVDVVAGEPLPAVRQWGATRLEAARQAVSFAE